MASATLLISISSATTGPETPPTDCGSTTYTTTTTMTACKDQGEHDDGSNFYSVLNILLTENNANATHHLYLYLHPPPNPNGSWRSPSTITQFSKEGEDIRDA